jgi:hypothetical protein
VILTENLLPFLFAEINFKRSIFMISQEETRFYTIPPMQETSYSIGILGFSDASNKNTCQHIRKRGKIGGEDVFSEFYVI